MPSAVVGDSAEVELIATGAIGDVEWGFAPPGHVALEPGLPPNRSLTNNGDGTATISGEFVRAGINGTGPYVVYAWDAAGQVAKIDGAMSVHWPLEPYAHLRADIPPDGSIGKFDLIGGPDSSVTVTVDFTPPLPSGWTTTEQNNGHLVTVNVGDGSWEGEVGFTFAEGWPSPSPRRVFKRTRMQKFGPI